MGLSRLETQEDAIDLVSQAQHKANAKHDSSAIQRRANLGQMKMPA